MFNILVKIRLDNFLLLQMHDTSVYFMIFIIKTITIIIILLLLLFLLLSIGIYLAVFGPNQNLSLP